MSIIPTLFSKNYVRISEAKVGDICLCQRSGDARSTYSLWTVEKVGSQRLTVVSQSGAKKQVMKRDGTEFGRGTSYSRYWPTFTIISTEEKAAFEAELEEMKELESLHLQLFTASEKLSKELQKMRVRGFSKEKAELLKEKVESLYQQIANNA